MIAKQETTYYDVVGIGNAIVDVLAKVGEGFLKERNLPKGGMTLVDAVTAGKIYADLVPEREVPGRFCRQYCCRTCLAGRRARLYR